MYPADSNCYYLFFAVHLTAFVIYCVYRAYRYCRRRLRVRIDRHHVVGRATHRDTRRHCDDPRPTSIARVWTTFVIRRPTTRVAAADALRKTCTRVPHSTPRWRLATRWWRSFCCCRWRPLRRSWWNWLRCAPRPSPETTTTNRSFGCRPPVPVRTNGPIGWSPPAFNYPRDESVSDEFGVLGRNYGFWARSKTSVWHLSLAHAYRAFSVRYQIGFRG